MHNRWDVLIGTLTSFNNVDCSYLTSIKMSLVLSYTLDPTMVINLGVLRECQNLKILCLSVNSISLGQLFVRNVEWLPKGISTLRFDSTRELHDQKMGKEILLNHQQIRWIINNLPDLESFWTSLIIQENINENNEQRENAVANNNDNFQHRLEEDMNRLANINVDTFRDLIAMPKLKDLKVRIMKSRALSIVVNTMEWEVDLRAGQGTTLDIVREFSDLCEAAGYTTTTTTSRYFGAGVINGFAKLTIQK